MNSELVIGELDNASRQEVAQKFVKSNGGKEEISLADSRVIQSYDKFVGRVENFSGSPSNITRT